MREHRGRKLGIPDWIMRSLVRDSLTAQQRVEDGRMLFEPFHTFPWGPLVLAERAIGVGRTA